MKKKRETKFVRVDSRTIIEVDARKSDKKAIQDFLEKTKPNTPQYLLRRKKHESD